MANKNARILWAVMTREQGFNAHHVSVKPAAKQKPAPVVAPAPTLAAPTRSLVALEHLNQRASTGECRPRFYRVA